MAFLADFTAIISQLSFRNIQLARLNSAQQQAKETLEQHRDELEKLVAARTHALEKVNAEQQQMLDRYAGHGVLQGYGKYNSLGQ